MTSSVDVLVVAAHAPELEGLGGLLGREFVNDVHGIRVAAKAVGLGLPGVSGGTVARIEALRPRALVLVGTCAAYPHRNLAPGQTLVAERLSLADAAVLQGWSVFPDPMTCQLAPNPALVTALSSGGCRRVAVASPLAITIDLAIASRIAQHLQCDVEHQEAFGVALACGPRALPFAAVFGVSHELGPHARETWRVTHRAAAQSACSLIAGWLTTGAVGLPHVA